MVQSKLQNRKSKIVDVLVGEVWLGSGQSNMAQTVKQHPRDKELVRLAARGYEQLRMLRQEPGACWEPSTPQTNQTFSAQLFAFGCRLQEKLDVPVGLMVGAVGATPSGSWITPEMFAADVDVQALVKQMAPAYDRDAYQREFDAERSAWTAKKAADEEEARKTGKPAPRPGPSPTRPAVAVGELHGGGRMGDLFEKHIRPRVGYAIRGVLWDQGESGTRIAGVDQATLMPALIQGWRSAWGQDFPFLYVQKPSGGGTAWDLDDPMHAAASKFAPQPAEVPPQFNPDLSWAEFRCRPRNNQRELWEKNTPEFSYGVHLTIMKTPGTFMVTSRISARELILCSSRPTAVGQATSRSAPSMARATRSTGRSTPATPSRVRTCGFGSRMSARGWRCGMPTGCRDS